MDRSTTRCLKPVSILPVRQRRQILSYLTFWFFGNMHLYCCINQFYVIIHQFTDVILCVVLFAFLGDIKRITAKIRQTSRKSNDTKDKKRKAKQKWNLQATFIGS